MRSSRNRFSARSHMSGGSGQPGSASPGCRLQWRMLRCNRLNHSGKLSLMSNTSPFVGCKRLCAAKPLFRHGNTAAGGRSDGGRIGATRKVSRTSPELPGALADPDGPENFKGRRRALAPRHIPDRFPVTAGIRSETATRPPDSARFSRRNSRRRTAFLLAPSSQCWPGVLRVCLPPSSSWTFSRLSFFCPLPFLMPSSWTISFYLMLSSSFFSCHLF